MDEIDSTFGRCALFGWEEIIRCGRDKYGAKLCQGRERIDDIGMDGSGGLLAIF